jgi:hypothetical protein
MIIRKDRSAAGSSSSVRSIIRRIARIPHRRAGGEGGDSPAAWNEHTTLMEVVLAIGAIARAAESVHHG